jgi:4-hydroxythreonine-4-phosphate dehydrogenase
MTSTTIALAIGDPNGIGPEIAVKAAASFAASTARVVLVGDTFVIESYAARVAERHTLREFSDLQPPQAQTIDILSVESLPRNAFLPGQIHASAGSAMVAYVEAALALVRAGRAKAIVGCPHNETAVHAAGIPFSGYPSLIARLCGVPQDQVFLMLVGGRLRIVHVTLHERLRDALLRLTPELIVAAGRTCATALARLGVDRPCLGLFGINPHAGEKGLFGDDDERITVPAAERLRAAGISVEGPIGADVMLGRTGLDAFIAMYHDQGHIPVKLLAGRTASGLTIGAGVLFSSVGHGSAFDIAGRGIADPEPVMRALQLVSGHAGSDSPQLARDENSVIR